MARYVICPRCELNFIDADEQEYCEVCLKELSGERTFAEGLEAEENTEEMELCPICGENYMQYGETMCEDCKKKLQYEEEELDIGIPDSEFEDEEMEDEEEEIEEEEKDDFEYVSPDDYFDFDDDEDDEDDEDDDF